MRSTLIDKCEQMIEATSWPYLQRNLKGQKVFMDLYQYYYDHVSNFSKINNASSANVGLKSPSPTLNKMNLGEDSNISNSLHHHAMK